MVSKKFICQNCGAVNGVDITQQDLEENSDDWLPCTLPTGFEWALPAGVIQPTAGDPIYISGNGEQLSREDYCMKYGIDPEIALRFMRGKLIRSSAYMSLDSKARERAKAGISKALKFSMADDDDWTA